MKVQQLAGAALFAVVAIGLVSWSLLTTKREQNQQQEKVELEQKLLVGLQDVTTCEKLELDITCQRLDSTHSFLHG